MASFWSCLLAFLQYCCRICIYRTPHVIGCGPLLSSIFVMVAVLILLWNTPLYPKYLRDLGRIAGFLFEYLVSVFIMEHIMGAFWFPLDIFIIAGLPHLGETLEELLNTYNWNCDILCSALKRETIGVICSYVLSFSILVSTLHGTRMIDLRLLQRGITIFVGDIRKRASKYLKSCNSARYPKIRPNRRKPRSPTNFRGQPGRQCDYDLECRF